LLSLIINKKYQILTTYKETKETIFLKSLNISLAESDLGKLLLGKLVLESSLLPDYIKYLSSIKGETVILELNSNSNLAFSYDEKIILNNTILEQMTIPTASPVGLRGVVNFPGMYPATDPLGAYTVFPQGWNPQGWIPESPYSSLAKRFKLFGLQDEPKPEE
jgi:hypothetical protein